MQLVIDIDEDDYKRLKEYKKAPFSSLTSRTYEAIANGTPLPKRHGRLIDADALGEKLNKYTEAPYQYALAVFNDSLTVIEADKAEGKEKA